MKIQRAVRGRLRALCLLSTSVPISRCHWTNVADIKQPGAFLQCCRLFFRRGINERPTTLDRQRRTPTKGRIQNTPFCCVDATSGRGPHRPAKPKGPPALLSAATGVTDDWCATNQRTRPSPCAARSAMQAVSRQAGTHSVRTAATGQTSEQIQKPGNHEPCGACPPCLGEGG